MGKFLKYCLLFISPFLIGICCLFYLPYPKKFAYNFIEDNCFNRSSELYQTIFENNKPVDFAFIGTSHLLNAVNDSLLNQIVTVNTASRPNISNLGFCWQGYNAEYVILKDLFEHKQPATIVLEVREWTENDNHIIFPYIGSSQDILNQPYFSNPACFKNLHDAILCRWEYFRFGYVKLDVNRPVTDMFGYMPRTEVISEAAAQKQINFQQRRFGPDGTHLNNFVKYFDRYYLNRIIELCRNNNAKLYFLYLPSYGDVIGRPVDSKFFSSDLLLIPDQNILADPANWSNSSHLNEKGADELTKWLAESMLFK